MKTQVGFTYENVHITFTAILNHIVPLSLIISLSLTLIL